MTRYGFLSTFPPTRCGLATFTDALSSALGRAADVEVQIVRVLDADEAALPAEALAGSADVVLRPGDRASARRAAAALDAGDVAIVQHEYGIYGGSDGDEVLQVLEGVRVPIVVVLHTVLPHPSPGQRSVLERVAATAAAVVVMTATARSLLLEHYSVPAGRVVLIPHGVRSLTRAPGSRPGQERGHHVLTWGLIGPGKGIEWGIRAMALLADSGARYTVLGQTHPKVLAHEGERYREHLQGVIDGLGLEDVVELDDRYLDEDGLAAAVAAADVVLLPYDSHDQVTSGVLVEALAAGLPVVATSFPHSIELLEGGPGIVVGHEDPEAIARALEAVFAAPASYGGGADLETTWSDVAEQYRSLVAGLLKEVAA